MANKKQEPAESTVALNRKGTFDYTLSDRYEAGIVLAGWEVKSIRAGKAQITDSYVILRQGAVFWLGGIITPLLSASTHVHPDPVRTRKLLLHQAEIRKLIGAVERKGFTLIPTKLYWKNRRIKLEFALAEGKKKHDKRADIKEKDWQRDKARLQRSKIMRSNS